MGEQKESFFACSLYQVEASGELEMISASFVAEIRSCPLCTPY